MNIEYEQYKKKSGVGKANTDKNAKPVPSKRTTQPSEIIYGSESNFQRGPSSSAIEKENEIVLPELIKLDNVKVNSSQKVRIQDVDVLFPYVPYECQIEYMKKVIDALNGKSNALLQSPTGTGKTLCMLCATLAWVNKYRENLLNKNPNSLAEVKPIRIFYSTRTHSQIKQVIKELKQTCYRPVTAVLGSRNQLCVRPDFSELSGFQLNYACKASRKTPIPEQRCMYYDNFMKNKQLIFNQNKTNLNDIEELALLGKRSKFCPYFLERDIENKADLIFLPYNYLLDENIRAMMEVDLENAIIIFDEAHNVESLAEEGASFSFSLRDLESCERDFKLLRQKLKEKTEEPKMSELDIRKLEYPIISLYNNMSTMKRDFEMEFKNSNANLSQNAEKLRGRICKGRDIFHIFKGMTYEKSTRDLLNDQECPFKGGVGLGQFPEFLRLLKIASDTISNMAVSKGGLEHFYQCSNYVYNLLRIDAEKRLKGTTNQDWSSNFIDSYNFYIHFGEESYTEFSFSMLCLNPAVSFYKISEMKPLSIMLTSGTLTPFDSFESELNLSFPIKLINNHVIDTKKQCSTIILRRGPANYPLNFSYEKRDDISVYNEMGTTLINIARLVPNGILVCFASYHLMQKCLDLWQTSDQRILKRLEEIKPVHKEPRQQDQLKVIMSQYIKDAKSKGAILCCVARGKVSEGIDFSDEMARAVVLVGVPFPPLTETKVKFKRQFLDENASQLRRISGKDWYLYQTIRAFNQAIGRVIRHVNDYGFVFLCDERYSGNQFQNEFPNWIKDNIEVVDKFGTMVGKVASFFKDRNKPASLDKLISKTKVEPNYGFQSSFNRSNLAEPNVFSNDQGSENTEGPRFLKFRRTQQTHIQEQRGPNLSNFMEMEPDQTLSVQNRNLSPKAVKQEPKEVVSSAGKSFQDIIQTKNQTLKKTYPGFESNTFGIKRIKFDQDEDIFSTEQNYNNSNRIEVEEKKPQNSTRSFNLNTFNPTEIDTQTNRTLVSQPVQSENRQTIERQSTFDSNNSLDFRFDEKSKDQEKSQNEPIQPNKPKTFDPSKIKQAECLICMEKGTNKTMMASKCGHIACEDCWEGWLKIKVECPVCKSKVRQKQLIKLHM